MHLESVGQTALLRLEGEFDTSGRKEFEVRMTEAVSKQPGEVILDLRELRFIDSTGLRLVLEAWNASLRKGFDFRVLLSSDGRLHDLFLETGLDQALPIETAPRASD